MSKKSYKNYFYKVIFTFLGILLLLFSIFSFLIQKDFFDNRVYTQGLVSEVKEHRASLSGKKYYITDIAYSVSNKHYIARGRKHLHPPLDKNEKGKKHDLFYNKNYPNMVFALDKPFTYWDFYYFPLFFLFLAAFCFFIGFTERFKLTFEKYTRYLTLKRYE